MSGDDEIVVTIEPELIETLGGDTEVKVLRGADEPIEDLKGQFAKMQSDLATANQRAVAAETEAQRVARERDQHAHRATELEGAVIDSRKGTVDQGIAAAKADADAAQADYERAFSDGDGKAAAEAQRRLARAESRIGRLTETKEELAEAKPAPRRAAAQTDPVEEYINGRSAPTAAWLRQHTEFITDPTKNAKLTSAHWDAVGEGLKVDTPEYFAHVEKRIGLKKDDPSTQQQLQRRPTAPTAPGGDVGGRGGVSEVKLTRGEANSATDGTLVWNYDDPKGKFKKGDPIGVQEMARRKLAMSQQGRYHNSMTEG